MRGQIGVILASSIMSSCPVYDKALASGITKLPVELKIVILDLTVYNNRKLVLELVAKSSLCKQWSVRLDRLLSPLHIVGLLQA
jgi:ABC-type lipopolysaccharide export system ATPase subunit